MRLQRLLLVSLATLMLAGPSTSYAATNAAPRLEAASGSNQSVKAAAPQGVAALTSMPGGYEREALRLVIQEANRVATELRLPDKLPITERDLVRRYMSPPAMAKITTAVGNVATSNYAYYVSIDRKFCFLEGMHQDADRRHWHSQYAWPVSLIDTNAAYQLATQWLSAASMDVEGLNRDCILHIHTYTEDNRQEHAERFLPVYWVYWTKGSEGHGSVASVELFTPTKTLMQLRVEDPKYILRKPLQSTNLDLLTSDTNK